jgi:hypothetical protein
MLRYNKEQLETVLQVLIGLELSRTTRAANMQCFHFGKLTVIDKEKHSANIHFTFNVLGV